MNPYSCAKGRTHKVKCRPKGLRESLSLAPVLDGSEGSFWRAGRREPKNLVWTSALEMASPAQDSMVKPRYIRDPRWLQIGT